MKHLATLAIPLLITLATLDAAESNATEAKGAQPPIQSVQKAKNSSEQNTTAQAEKSALQKHLREQIEREKKYAKEQKFYQGKEYNLSEHKVTKDQLDAVPVIEPDYDFDITDVYRDDI